MTGQQLVITAVAAPQSYDAGTGGGAGGTGGVTDFRDCHALREAHELEKWGDLDRCPTLMESLEYWRGNEYEQRLLFMARLGQQTVGMCSVTLPLRENYVHGRDHGRRVAGIPPAGLGPSAAGARRGCGG
jgi:hypothetical protein